MKILLLGSGGREHALAWKIAQSPKVSQLFIAPGNAGTMQVGKNVDIKADDFDGIAQFVLDYEVDIDVYKRQILKPTPSSLAMMFESVVFPSPGGPCKSVWSSGSPRYFAASTNTRKFSTTFCCPLKSSKARGRKAFSNSRSDFEGVCRCV